jgi:hypothetical protein
MVALLDEVLGNVTALLKARGMWQDTLMVLSSEQVRKTTPLALPPTH